jgi:hypothetical protein
MEFVGYMEDREINDNNWWRFKEYLELKNLSEYIRIDVIGNKL